MFNNSVHLLTYPINECLLTLTTPYLLTYLNLSHNLTESTTTMNKSLLTYLTYLLTYH